MEPTQPRKCFASGKTRFATPAHAKEAILKIKSKKDIYDHVAQKRVKRRNGKASQCRYYFCVHCKGFHLTSVSKILKQKTIEKEYEQRLRDTEGLVITADQAASWKADSLPFPELKTNTNEMVQSKP